MDLESIAEAQIDKHGDARWMDTHEQFSSEAKSKEADVLFIGGTHIAWLRNSQVFGDLLAPLHCLCFGCDGDTTANVAWRLINGEIDNVKPKVVALMIGSSDAGSSEQIVSSIAALAQFISKKQPEAQLLVMKCLPCGRKPNPRRALLSEVNAGLSASVAHLSNVTVIDCDPGFVASDGTIDCHDLFDYVHLTQEGYTKVFDILAMTVMSILRPDESILTSAV